MARTEEGRRGGVENGLGGQEICLIVGNDKKTGITVLPYLPLKNLMICRRR